MPETIQLSSSGPELPTELLDSILAGEVVFLCGAGVSVPQLPGFAKLVCQTYEKLHVAPARAEKKAFADGRYEEVLGALGRRLADPSAVERTVSDLLAVPETPDLEQHKTVLRLSRGLDNRISVVTTNFDTLFERAAGEVQGTPDSRPKSSAGQALPAPGSARFSGIIHIHGRLEDAGLGLEATPLVLTSADYGDAYLRSGWASRFFFDLVRCKVIVLLGYRANDAPVRYILNVLTADRARFPDIRGVYAFDAYSRDEEEVHLRWETVAVSPIAYRKVDSDHSALWRSLARLTEIAERPRRWAGQWARAILLQPASPAEDNSIRQLRWLARHPSDLWSIVIKEMTDPEWFNTFSEKEIWSEEEDAVWIVPAWVALDFQNPDRLEVARHWQNRLGRRFTDWIGRRLRSSPSLDDRWSRIWRLFCLADPATGDDSTGYVVKGRLESGLVLASDLEAAVRRLGPRLELEKRYEELLPDGEEPQRVRRLSDVMWPRLVIPDRHWADELVIGLRAMEDRALEILDVATAGLRSALALEVDLELISEDHDVNDFEIASIEAHAQNEHQEGVSLLVRRS